jgi:hypothetical protein
MLLFTSNASTDMFAARNPDASPPGASAGSSPVLAVGWKAMTRAECIIQTLDAPFMLCRASSQLSSCRG